MTNHASSITGRRKGGIAVLAMAITLATAGCAASAPNQRHAQEAQRIADNLANFDDLDFNVFTGQQWDQLHRSHADDIVVHWPDGRTTTGVDAHIEDLKGMFVWAPDTRIEEHPIKVGQGEWTAVVGIIEGTFTEPMPIGEGKTIPPTGKAYKLRMVTVGHWTEAGVMDEEYLFWDNKEFYRQLGLGE